MISIFKCKLNGIINSYHIIQSFIYIICSLQHFIQVQPNYKLNQFLNASMRYSIYWILNRCATIGMNKCFHFSLFSSLYCLFSLLHNLWLESVRKWGISTSPSSKLTKSYELNPHGNQQYIRLHNSVLRNMLVKIAPKISFGHTCVCTHFRSKIFESKTKTQTN